MTHLHSNIARTLTTTITLLTLCACGDSAKDGTQGEILRLDFGAPQQEEDMGPPKKRTPRCEENQRVQDHQCIPCEPGRERAAGDNPDGINTWCEPTLCEVHEHAQNFQCVPCPIEEYNEQTHRASDGETSCLRDRCSETIGAACKRFDEAYIKAIDPRNFDSFGKKISIHKDLLAVSSPGFDEPDCLQCGAVFIYERGRGDKWTYRATITTPNKAVNARFGASVILRDDLLIVGATGESEGELQEHGAVYIFTRQGDDATTWQQTQRLTAFNMDTLDSFGASLALSSDAKRLVVGALLEDGLKDDVPDSGAVYLFERSGEDQWKPAGYIKPNDLEPDARFGTAIALDDDMLAISAPYASRTIPPAEQGQEERSLTDAGLVYLYTLKDARWDLAHTLSPELAHAQDLFGTSLDMANGNLVVGAPGEDGANTGVGADPTVLRSNNAGAAYLFKINPDDTVSKPLYIKPGYTHPAMYFGNAITVTDDMIVIGAHRDNTISEPLNGTPSTTQRAAESGAVFVLRPYSSSPHGWEQIAVIKAREEDAYDRFGDAISVYGTAIAIGAPNEDSGRSGTGNREGGDGALDSGAAYIRNVGHFKYR